MKNILITFLQLHGLIYELNFQLFSDTFFCYCNPASHLLFNHVLTIVVSTYRSCAALSLASNNWPTALAYFSAQDTLFPIFCCCSKISFTLLFTIHFSSHIDWIHAQVVLQVIRNRQTLAISLHSYTNISTKLFYTDVKTSSLITFVSLASITTSANFG